MRNSLLVITLSSAIGACGGGTSTPPTSPSPAPQVPQNRPPVISSVSVSPEFAVGGLGTITYTVTASDPDNDTLTYRWTFGDLVRTDASGTFPATTPVLGAQVTVTDTKGQSATEMRPLVVSNLTGTWRGQNRYLGNYSLVLTQDGIVVSGTYQDPDGSGQVRPEDGRIDQDGNIQMRVKQPPFADYFFRGQVDRSTGTMITGGIFESGFTGEPFTLSKQ